LCSCANGAVTPKYDKQVQLRLGRFRKRPLRLICFATPYFGADNARALEFCEHLLLRIQIAASARGVDHKFVGQESYPGITADFERSFALLNHLPCDIFLASHGSFFHFVEKHERLLRGDANAFIDLNGYKAYLRESEQEFRNKLAQQKAAQK